MRQSDSVLLIYTGGTIGMYKTNEGSLRPFDLDTLSTQIPELKTFDIDINAISIAAHRPPICPRSRYNWQKLLKKSTTIIMVLLFFMAQTPWHIRRQRAFARKIK